jgi:hypothetical protein
MEPEKSPSTTSSSSSKVGSAYLQGHNYHCGIFGRSAFRTLCRESLRLQDHPSAGSVIVK